MGALADFAIRLDPALIFNRAGLIADPWQAELLRDDESDILLNCSRQSGKTTTVAGIASKAAKINAPSKVLILSPTQRQSAETLRACMAILGNIVDDADFEAESALHVELSNKSRILALPGKDGTVRGVSSVDLLIIDEASRVPDSLYFAVEPMLAVSHGRRVLLSTPWGKRGFFYDEWTSGEGWKRVCITAEQCPRITAEFLAKEKKKLPHNWYRQEFFCEFVDVDDAVFRYDDVQAAMSDEVEPLFDAPSVGMGEVEPMFTQ